MDWLPAFAASVFGALALRGWQRLAPAPPSVADPRVDWVVAITLGVAGWAWLSGVHHRLNPEWVPYGQDNRDYLACLGALRNGDREAWVPFRYPLFPWISAVYGYLSGIPVYRASMQVSVVTSALVPVGAYVLGRAISARPVALAASLVALVLQVDPEVLGTPSPYPFATAMYAMSLGSLVFAIRDGGVRRHACAGLALSTYMAVTSKAFPMILGGTAALVAVQLAARQRDLRALGAFFAPMTVVWLAFAWLDLPLHTLEALMFDVQKLGNLVDPSKPFPDVGWGPEQLIGEQGYWKIGSLSALIHLPQVLVYFLFPPLYPVTMQERYDHFVPQVAANLGVDAFPWVVLLTFAGGIGAWARGAPAARSAFAAAFATSVPLVHLWGLASTQYTERFANPVLCTSPTLLLALAALPARHRTAAGWRTWAAWLPLLVATGWLLGPSKGPLGHEHVETRIEGWLRKPPDTLLATRPLVAALRPGDEVLDLSFTHLAPVLLESPGVRYTRGVLTTRRRADGEYLWLVAPGAASARRWVFLDCVALPVLWPQDPMRDVNAWFARNSQRFTPAGRCLYLDRDPFVPVDTEPSGIRLQASDTAPGGPP